MSSDSYILGLDIGGTKTAVVLGDRAGQVCHRDQFNTVAERGFEAVFEQLCVHTEKVRYWAEHMGRSPDCISVSIGGPLDVEQGIIYS
ncbi:unnamed protein product, partial [marine sediment metagenome]